MKKLLAILSAVAMLMGMMGTVVLAAGVTTINYTSANYEEGFFELYPVGEWTYNSTLKTYTSAVNTANAIEKHILIKPYSAGLAKGFYELYQCNRGQGGACSILTRYDFSGTNANEQTTVLNSEVIYNGNYVNNKVNAFQYVGTYCFNGTEDETIRVGLPYIESSNEFRLISSSYVPVTEKNVRQKYTVTKGETLTMPIIPELLGETKGIEYDVISCDSHIGNVTTENGCFMYTAPENVLEDTFSITATLNECVITIIVNVDIVDDNAIYFDDADGESTGEVKTVYNSGFGGSRKALGDDDSFKWSITGIAAGVYDAYFYKTGKDGFDAVQNVTVNYNGKSANTSVSSLADGKEGWVKIGTFDFAGNGSEFIETSRKNTSDYYFASADAIKLVPVEKEITRTINIFAGQTYKESALLTFADSDYLPEITSGNASAAENTIVYTAENTGSDSFTVNCGEYVINYDVTVSDIPEAIVADINSATVTKSNGWVEQTVINGHAGDSDYASCQYVNGEGEFVTWNIPEGMTAGYYKLQIWKCSPRATHTRIKNAAEIIVNFDGGADTENFVKRGLTYHKSKDTGYGEWIDVGTYLFQGNGKENVTLTDLDTSSDVSENGEKLYFGGFRLVPVTDTTTSNGSYKEDYRSTISALEADVNLTSKFTVSNDSQGKNANVIKVIYNNGTLESVEFLEEVYIEPYSNEEIHHVFTAPAENEGDDKKVVIFLWDRENGLVPVANNIALD